MTNTQPVQDDQELDARIRGGEGRPDPIFVLGVERSGTTLLYSLLANHPDLYWFSRSDALGANPTLSHMLRTGFTFIEGRVPQVAVPGAIARSRGLLAPTEYGRYWKRVFGFGNEDEYRVEDDRLSGSGRAAITDEKLRRDISKRIELSGKKRALFKWPGHTTKIPYLARVFPGAHFVHIVRHPASHVRSLVEAKKRFPDQRFWGLKTPGWRGHLDSSYCAQALTQITEAMRIVEEDLSAIDGERYLQVRYEDLVSDPEVVLSRVLERTRLSEDAAFFASLERVRPSIHPSKIPRDIDCTASEMDTLRLLCNSLGYEQP